MRAIRLDQDVRSLSELRAGVAAFVQQVNETRRPLLLAQRGRGVAVLVDVRESRCSRSATAAGCCATMRSAGAVLTRGSTRCAAPAGLPARIVRTARADLRCVSPPGARRGP